MKIIPFAFVLFCCLTVKVQLKSVSHDGFDRLLKQHVDSRGVVDYHGFIKDSVKLNAYLRLLSENPPQKSWSRNEQMAFWINAYNAYTIKLITKYYPLNSIKDIGSKIQIPFVNTPWDIKFIQIGKDRYDLNNIEHGILRKKFDDPRIHMVLVCASKSCPVLLNEAYHPARLDDQLTNQSKAFLDDSTRNQVSARHPKLSRIFSWYGMDFNTNGNTVKDFVNRYAAVKIPDDATIDYMEYDWTLNE
jgi:hypothetical protein